MSVLRRYARWLHTGWPAGTVEKLPEVGKDGATAVPGVRVVGDLTGIPLLKFSVDTGTRAVRAILAEDSFKARRGRDADVADLVIVGAGVSGIAAALEAKKAGLTFRVLEAAQPFATLHGFPKQKPIYTYPTEMRPAGDLAVTAEVKEVLIEELEAQRLAANIPVESSRVERLERRGDEIAVHVAGDKRGETTVIRALRAIVAIGRSGNYRRLEVPGEDLDKVYQRLYDPRDYAGRDALVVGGGDSALESAIALAVAGARVTLSYRGRDLARPKPENVEKLQALEKDPAADVEIEEPTSERVNAAMTSNMRSHEPGRVRVLLGSKIKAIRPDTVHLVDGEGAEHEIRNDVVFAMIGREAPLDFFRRSGIPIRGEWRPSTWIGFAAFFAFCLFVYTWKAGTDLNAYFSSHKLFPFNLPEHLGDGAFARTLAVTLRQPGFYYSFAYTVCILLFGWRRVRRRNTPYVKWQTLSLGAFQLLPLFLLPYFILPTLGYAGFFDGGVAKSIADHLFPTCGYDYGREYWRAFGLVLAWPLFLWNLFTSQPMNWWLAIGLIQTFVIIPVLVFRWGKGAYCGWICSCGALAETLGDGQRHKMPHGPRWNRVNFVGQAILAFAFLLFLSRIAAWYFPDSSVGRLAVRFYDATFYAHAIYDYYHVVDIFLAGVVGVGMYFWFSGRVWDPLESTCRHASLSIL